MDHLLTSGGVQHATIHHGVVESGFNRLMPPWSSVYVGMSARSMLLAPQIGSNVDVISEGNGVQLR